MFTKKTHQESPQKRLSQLEAAKYFFSKYQDQHPLAWTTYIMWGFGSALTWLAPSVVVADILTNLQSGAAINYNIEIAKAIGFVILGEMLTRATLHLVSIWEIKAADTLYKDSFSSLLDKSAAFHANNFAGSVSNKVNKFASAQVGFIDVLHFNVVDYLATLAFTLVVVGFQGLIAIGILVLSLAVYVILLYPIVRNRLILIRKRTRAESKRTGDLVDGVTNALAVKSFAGEEFEYNRFANQVDIAGNLRKRSWLYTVWRIDPVTVVFFVVLTYGPLVYLVNSAEIELGAGQIFITYTLLARLGGKIWQFARIWRNIETQLAEGAEALEMLNEPDDVSDLDDATVLRPDKGYIDIREVDFSYENQQLYSDFNLAINPGEKIGLVGPSGGGKTTLVKLLMRFMDIDSGSIKIDGQDISQVTQQSLRQNISYIPQEPALFHRTIRENIAYGKLDASEDEVIEAAKKSHAHEFIETLPKGYDTLVGERGVKLSGGQRQRVAIARAFLKDAPILVLDEATSALDSESEQLIQASLVDLMKGRTVLSIAHRLSTLQIMDRLVVICDGAIEEQGTHAQLLGNDGTYARLWSHQSGDYLAD